MLGSELVPGRFTVGKATWRLQEFGEYYKKTKSDVKVKT